jgi:hypothetical protein
LRIIVLYTFGNFLWKLLYNKQLKLGKRFFIRGLIEKNEISTPLYLIAKLVINIKKLEL